MGTSKYGPSPTGRPGIGSEAERSAGRSMRCRSIAELIEMRRFGELAYEEIATLKRLPLGTVKNELSRARQMLKEQLSDFLTD